ncbi:MAG: hypothetical protein KIT79_12550 [Deltaproteobacteria bacterium]|nr:hypothetical protein [Deltaproteobacteria bacterium]
MQITRLPGALRNWRDPVATVPDLPDAGNREGDIRVVLTGPGDGAPVIRIWKGGVWTVPAGESALQWLTGSGAPGNETGSDGQFYVDTASPGLDFYVKSGGEWAFSGQLRGPAGEPVGEGGADTGQLMGFDEGVLGDATSEGEPLPDTVTAEILPYEIEFFEGSYEGAPPPELGNPGSLARDTAAGDGQNAIWYRHGRTGWELLGVTAGGAILDTDGPPDNGTGEDMDLAVDAAAGKAYIKDSGSWSEVYDIGTQLGVAMASLRFALYSGATAREAARLEDIQALDGDAGTDGFSVGWYDHSDPQVAVVFTAGSPTAETALGLRRWRAAIRRDGKDGSTRISTYAVQLPDGPALVMLDRTQSGAELAAFVGPLLGTPGPFLPMAPVSGAAFHEGMWKRVLSVDSDGWPVLGPTSGASAGIVELVFDSGATPDGSTVFSDWESMMEFLMDAIAEGAPGARIRCRSNISVPVGGVPFGELQIWPVEGIEFVNARNSYSTGGNASPIVITLEITEEESVETARAILAGTPRFSGGPFEVEGLSGEDAQLLITGTAGGNPETGSRLVLDDVAISNGAGAGVIGGLITTAGTVVIGRGRTVLGPGSFHHDDGLAPLVLLDGQSVLADDAVVGIDDDSQGLTVVHLTQETRASTVHAGYSGTVSALTPDRLGDSMDDPEGAPAAYIRLDLSSGKLRVSDGAGGWETVTLDT